MIPSTPIDVNMVDVPAKVDDDSDSKLLLQTFAATAALHAQQQQQQHTQPLQQQYDLNAYHNNNTYEHNSINNNNANSGTVMPQDERHGTKRDFHAHSNINAHYTNSNNNDHSATHINDSNNSNNSNNNISGEKLGDKFRVLAMQRVGDEHVNTVVRLLHSLCEDMIVNKANDATLVVLPSHTQDPQLQQQLQHTHGVHKSVCDDVLLAFLSQSLHRSIIQHKMKEEHLAVRATFVQTHSSHACTFVVTLFEWQKE